MLFWTLVVLATVFLLSLCSDTVLTQSTSRKKDVELKPEVAEQMNLLTEMLFYVRREGGACLTGREVPNGWVVEGIFIPPHFVSTIDASQTYWALCPVNTIAYWHNHPRGNCALSPQDIRSAKRRSFPVSIVQVGRDSWCWWSRSQIETLGSKDGEKALYSLPGQEIVRGVTR